MKRLFRSNLLRGPGRAAFVIAASAPSASFAAPVFMPPGEKAEPTVSEIRLERTACEGNCPTDKTVLRSDGSALYVGRANVPTVGTFQGRVEPGSVQKLGAMAKAQGFYDLKEQQVKALDVPTFVVTVVRASQSKTIEDSGGAAPLWLWGFEMATRGVAADIRWKKVEMKGPSGIWGRAREGPLGAINNFGQADSRPRPRTVLIVQKAGQEVSRTTTDGDGCYEIALDPGDYTLAEEPKDGPQIGGLKPQPFTVKAKEWTEIVAEFDTGIR